MIALKRNYLKPLALACWALVALTQLHATWAQAPEKVNDFPIMKFIEAYNGKTERTNTSFNIYFPADDNRYLPIREELAARLSVAPLVSPDSGLQARVTNTLCTPKKLLIEMDSGFGYVDGGEIRCDVEITPTPSAKRGTHEVKLSFTFVDLINQELKGLPPTSRAVAVFKVDVWPSPEAKQAALRSAEEQRQREADAKADALRQKQELAREKLREQEELEAQARREGFRAIAWKAATVLALLLPFGAFIYLKRKWLWPEMKLELAQGEHKQLRAAVRGPRNGKHVEPGTILQTTWARNFIGRRHRIKLETFSSEDSSHMLGLHRSQAEHQSVGFEENGDSKLDLLITVGASVRPGSYLSKVRNHGIRIKVERARTA
jgi:hypothetical protein